MNRPIEIQADPGETRLSLTERARHRARITADVNRAVADMTAATDSAVAMVHARWAQRWAKQPPNPFAVNAPEVAR